jgi:Tol biopolymer transport system component
VTITNGQGIDEIWVGEVARPGLRRIAAVSDADLLNPVFSPDGHRIAFGRRGRNDDDGIYVMDPDSASPAVRVVKLPRDERRLILMGWTPDGSSLLASRSGADGKSDVVRALLPTEPGKLAEFRPIVATPANEWWAALSPDGRWLAWVSDESGRDEVYVGSFDASGRVGNGLQVTKSGGRQARWSRDGRQLRYVDLNREVFSLPMTTSPSLATGPTKLEFDESKLNVFAYDLLPDGRQLAVIRGEDETDETRNCAVVLNWTQELLAKSAKR